MLFCVYSLSRTTYNLSENVSLSLAGSNIVFKYLDFHQTCPFKKLISELMNLLAIVSYALF